jgi:UDP-N-acetylglucosamine:LPS N-acetylglucosamine transferase
MGALSYDAIISEISETLRLSEKPNVQFIAICGRNKAKADQLRAWAASQNFPRNASLLVTEFIDQTKIKQLQNVSDLIISKPGGLTTFELLTTGKAVIMTEGIGLQEKHNATYVAQEGAALYLPKPSGIGNAAYNLLIGDPSLSARLVQKQTELRKNFQLDKIVDWVRTARVLQAERPETTVLERQRQLRNQPTRSAAVIGGRCSALFSH